MVNPEFTVSTPFVHMPSGIMVREEPASYEPALAESASPKWRDDILEIRMNLLFVCSTIATVIAALEGQSADRDLDFAQCLRHCALDPVSVQAHRLKALVRAMEAQERAALRS